ncbi:MAG: 3,4-dehydroadipyl-CoA semialdehyde dehydrogenase [candidate division Zixibacteria bacterium]|nr:3,4-dehydroadipyl-CoA semialdehyde dehydrogenase [candidate division Zixibacteria bacterium]
MEAVDLKSFVSGKWVAGSDRGTALVNPSNGVTVAWAGSRGVDLSAALDYSRRVGGQNLRQLTYASRAALLGRIAETLAAHRERWNDISRINSGCTKSDAALDVDGSIGTLKYFARLGAKLGETSLLADDQPAQLTRAQNFQGCHVGVPLHGVAILINAFNFPAWGLWEKAAVSILAGVPVLAKPATATAWLAQEMVESLIAANVLPEGSLSILCGSVGDLLDHVCFGDVVSFTGSASTGAMVRWHDRVRAQGIRVNVEADSLNSAILGPDGAAGTPAFQFFVREVVREMTIKAGQKCTAIRRILVPADRVQGVTEAIAAELAKVVVGDPSDLSVSMGPVVNDAQRTGVEDGVRTLSREAEIVFNPRPPSGGAFVAPTLLKLHPESEGRLVNEVEVFGPVATVIPYRNSEEAFEIARRGGGSLAASVYSADSEYLAGAAAALGSSTGRILLVDPTIGDLHPGHGVVLPSLTHGGPGRAGGGEELGGLNGLWFYHQKVALQGSDTTLKQVLTRAGNPR